MAKHRITIDGHMMWFDTDEEYEAFMQKQKEIQLREMLAEAESKRRQEEELRRKQEAEDAERIAQIIKKTIIIAIIIVPFVVGLCSHKTEKSQQKVTQPVNAQKKIEKVENQPVQTMPVVNQPVSSVIDAEAENNMIPELLDVPKQQIELVEVEERTGWEDAEMEKVSEPDFSRQKVYQSVEVDEEPQFPGGERGLLDYIDENLIYPQTAIEEAVQGRVFVNFIIEPNGSVSNVKVLRGLGFGCDEEAVRIIKSLPNWEPARRRNKEVRVAMTVPVNFKL